MWIVLLLVLAAWFIVPFIPALREWYRRDDATPMPIADEYEQDVHLAAPRFAAMMTERLESLCDDCMTAFGKSDTGAKAPPAYVMVWNESDPLLGDASSIPPDTPYFFAPTRKWRLPSGVTLHRDAFTVQTLFAGTDSVFLSLYGMADLHLAPGSKVERWLHAEGKVTVGRNCRLIGNASSDDFLHIDETSTFERLEAPTIQFGNNTERSGEMLPRERIAYRPAGCYEKGGNRTFVRGNLSIPPHHEVDGDVVVTGCLILGEGARIRGNVKAHDRVTLGTSAEVTGHLFCGGDLSVGSRSILKGVVSAEGILDAGPGCVFGSIDAPTTVSAERIRVAVGVRMHGLVWALGDGVVIADRSAPQPTPKRRFQQRIFTPEKARQAAGSEPVMPLLDPQRTI